MGRAIAASVVLLLPGCFLGPLDLLGRETVVTEHEELEKDEALEDDRIEDKNPTYDPTLTVTQAFEGCEVTLNKSGSVTKLDILPFAGEEATLDGKLFRGRAEALAGLPAGADSIPSMEVINGYLKPFNDGLYAAVEMAVQDGTAGVPFGKRAFLLDLLAALEDTLAMASTSQTPPVEDAIVLVAAGLMAGGQTVSIRADLQAEAEEIVRSAPAQELRPVGFYTWNDTLEGVFSQDRLLQQGESMEAFAAIAVVLAADPHLRSRYQSLLALHGGITNPFVSHTPEDLIPYVNGLATLDNLADLRAQTANLPPLPPCTTGGFWALFPASRSRDTEYFATHYCLGVPSGVSLIDELIAAIRRGEVDLTPAADSGWYDYQLWALETLLLPERGPESDHLLLTKAYKEKLIETFKSLITQARETHVKQLARFITTSAPPPEVEVYPQFPVEPFPTYYLRVARGYRFLGTVLEGILGSAFLDEARRLDEHNGYAVPSLARELAQVIELTYGLYFLAAASVGLRAETYLLDDELAEIDVAAAKIRANEWLDGWQVNPEVLRDPRVIVPVGTDGGYVYYWATVGVKVFKVRAEFVPGYEPEVVSGNFCVVTGFRSHETFLLSEHMVEVRIRYDAPPPTRDELRALCDQYDDADSIARALESL